MYRFVVIVKIKNYKHCEMSYITGRLLYKYEHFCGANKQRHGQLITLTEMFSTVANTTDH